MSAPSWPAGSPDADRHGRQSTRLHGPACQGSRWPHSQRPWPTRQVSDRSGAGAQVQRHADDRELGGWAGASGAVAAGVLRLRRRLGRGARLQPHLQGGHCHMRRVGAGGLHTDDPCQQRGRLGPHVEQGGLEERMAGLPAAPGSRALLAVGAAGAGAAAACARRPRTLRRSGPRTQQPRAVHPGLPGRDPRAGSEAGEDMGRRRP